MSKEKNGGAMLIGYIAAKHGLKKDADVARLINVSAPSISKIKAGKAPVTPAIIINVMDGAKMSLKQIRDILSGGEVAQ